MAPFVVAERRSALRVAYRESTEFSCPRATRPVGPLIGFVGYTPSPCRAQEQEPAFHTSELSLKRRGMLGSFPVSSASLRDRRLNTSSRVVEGEERTVLLSLQANQAPFE